MPHTFLSLSLKIWQIDPQKHTFRGEILFIIIPKGNEISEHFFVSL